MSFQYQGLTPEEKTDVLAGKIDALRKVRQLRLTDKLGFYHVVDFHYTEDPADPTKASSWSWEIIVDDKREPVKPSRVKIYLK